MMSPVDVVELRRYTLHPGARETLIELFDRELVEPQETVGMRVIGQFRDLDAPDHFVWLRGFRDMAARDRGLRAFYEGPVWAAHRDAANATMIDSDDVLLLRPARPDAGLVPEAGAATSPAPAKSPALFVIATYPLASDDRDGFLTFFEREVRPVLAAADGEVRALYSTEHSPNTFPALPVRDGDNVLVTISAFADRFAHARHEATLRTTPRWRDEVIPALRERLAGEPHVARLAPTERSRLRD